MADPSDSTTTTTSAAPAATSSSASNEIEINIRAPGDKKSSVTIDPSKTVAELKALVATKTDIEADRQRLIYSGRVLKDEEKVEVYKIRPGDTVHLVKGASKTPAPPAAQQVPQNLSTGNAIAGNPLAPLLNATNPGIGNFNPFAEMGVNPNDPDMMRNLLNTPQAQQQMQNLLSDPAIIDQVINSSPELRGMAPQMRQIMQSDQFRQMLSNPQAMAEMMRQAEQMRNNPLLSQMMGGGGLGGMGAFGGQDPWGAAFGGAGQQGQAGQTEQQQQQQRGPTNLFNPQPPSQGAGSTGGAAPGPAGMPDFSALQQMLAGTAGLRAVPGSPPAQQDSRPPEERFQNELQTLSEMGFVNASVNVRALLATGGNVQAAVEYILSQQSW